VLFTWSVIALSWDVSAAAVKQPIVIDTASPVSKLDLIFMAFSSS
jgi:hypothetical protein